MVITEVRIKLCEANNERLLAFCSVTFDNAFVVRDLKIIEGTKGMFVAMPSRKLTDRCDKCGCKNHLRARFCNSCGGKLDEHRAMRDTDGRAKLHADIAHPIHSAAREQIQGAVIKAYCEEKERAKMPGYICTYDEYDYDRRGHAGELRRGGGRHGSRPSSRTARTRPPRARTSHTDAPVAKTPTKGDDFASGIV